LGFNFREGKKQGGISEAGDIEEGERMKIQKTGNTRVQKWSMGTVKNLTRREMSALKTNKGGEKMARLER